MYACVHKSFVMITQFGYYCFYTLFQMQDLEKKLNKELNAGSHIIACRFPLSSKTPIQTIGFGMDRVWIYKC